MTNLVTKTAMTASFSPASSASSTGESIWMWHPVESIWMWHPVGSIWMWHPVD